MLILSMLVMVFAAGGNVFAYGTAADVTGTMDIHNTLEGNRPGRPKPNSASQKRKGMPQDAAAAAGGLGTHLGEIFTLMNENQQPDAELISKASIHLKGCRIFLKKFTKAEVGKYYMLTAWVNHFSGDSDKALRAIKRAYKTYNQNFDIRATDISLALLTNNKPSEAPKKQKKLEGDNILDFDTTSFRNDLLDRKITPFRANCLNSTTFNYTPGQAALCVMFWQLKEDSTLNRTVENSAADPNGMPTAIDPNGNPVSVKPKKPTLAPKAPYARPNQRPGSGPGQMMGPGGMPGGLGMPGMPPGSMYGRPGSAKKTELRKPTTFAEEMSAFAELYLNTYGDGKIKFLAINTDQTTGLSTVVNKLAESNWPWAQTMAKLPQSGGQQFTDISVKKPILAIIDKTGTIKYAGSAKGFLPKMILTNIANIDLGSHTPQTAVVEQISPPRSRPQVQPAVSATPARPARKNTFRELAPEEDFQAQKLLNAAKDIFLNRRSARLITPKRGIELCRRIIKDYPNTKYADEARTLLRENVDPRYRKRYNITDEELGL